jgi:CheY-like chemotaxis protein
MDIQLPVLDGYDATRQALPGLAAISIIAVSSFAMIWDEEKARAAGWLEGLRSDWGLTRGVLRISRWKTVQAKHMGRTE